MILTTKKDEFAADQEIYKKAVISAAVTDTSDRGPIVCVGVLGIEKKDRKFSISIYFVCAVGICLGHYSHMCVQIF